MQTLEQANNHAADLYWLAFLLTGRREPSVGLAVEVLGSREGASTFFSTWMLAWSRKVVIAKALAVIRDELQSSARRTRSRRAGKLALPLRNWAIQPDTTKVQLERALLAIDAFPRCALVLATFEGLPLEDSAILLDAGRELVRKAQIIGLQELTRNLAHIEGWSSTATGPAVLTGAMQHA